VAKTRSKSRKPGASSTRAKGTKKSARKRKTAVKRAKPARLDLKVVRRDIERARARLGTRPSALSAGASLDETQAALGRLMAEIDGFCAGGNCGPSMVIA
jgi:starvation-inducible outer membrane lipoprotein